MHIPAGDPWLARRSLPRRVLGYGESLPANVKGTECILVQGFGSVTGCLIQG